MSKTKSTRFVSQCTSAALLSAAAGLLGLAGCSEVGGQDPSCTSGKCDSFDRDLLDGRNDPIASYLKTLDISDDGLLQADYKSVLFGVADLMGCSEDSVAVFTVSDDLISGSPFPRLVSVACSDDDSKASDFFIAASFEDRETGDVDIRDVEMFAWDRTARDYMFYAFAPDDEENVKLEVGPKRCEGCHLTPADTSPIGMRMTPIMNELNRPWTHWNAEPGFPSHEFELPAGMENMPDYKSLALDHQAPAQRLEEIVKFGGHQKVASARIRDRRNSPNIDEIMGMLRPVFCNEQINYVSEDHDSGVLFNSALVDPGVRNMYVQIRPDNWPWAWTNDQTIRMSAPSGDAVSVIPVRGNADIAMETSLVSRRVLTPQQILRVRALDWQSPVFSDFRCDLWKDAYDRFRATPPDFGTASRNLSVMPDIFEQIMSVNGQPLGGSSADTLIMMPKASTSTATALLAATEAGRLEDGNCESDGFCAGTVDDFGAVIELHVESILGGEPRRALREARNERICHVLEGVESAVDDDRFPDGSSRFPNQPSLPQVSCP